VLGHPRRRASLEPLMVSQLVIKFTAFYTVFTRGRHRSLFLASLILFTSSNAISLRCILMLFYLPLYLPDGHFSRGFRVEIMYSPFLSMRATFPSISWFVEEHKS
jgi:hypothetical protein